MKPPVKIQLGGENLLANSGLDFIGRLLETSGLKEELAHIPGVHCVDPTFSHSDIVFAMTGLLCMGRRHYSDIEWFRQDSESFCRTLGLSGVPSSETLRQRLDLIGDAANGAVRAASARMVGSSAPEIGAVETSCGDFVPLDADVSPFDNSKTEKEGVSRTYKGCDGYAPMLAYLGREGYFLFPELRRGSRHCQKSTPEFLDEALKHARRITSAPILVRLDSGNDSKDNFAIFEKYEGVEFIVKRNPRRESPSRWLELAQNAGREIPQREGKRTWIGQTKVGLKGQNLPYPIVFKISERTTKKGQMLAFPEVEIETYWCSLERLPPEEAIELYRDHGTSEQFHSEIKTDMGMERFPSVHFETNGLILHLTALAYNMPRIVGQLSLEHSAAVPPCLKKNRRENVGRRRLGTVIRDLILTVGRWVKKGRQFHISLGWNNPLKELWERIAESLRAGSPQSASP